MPTGKTIVFLRSFTICSAFVTFMTFVAFVVNCLRFAIVKAHIRFLTPFATRVDFTFLFCYNSSH